MEFYGDDLVASEFVAVLKLSVLSIRFDLDQVLAVIQRKGHQMLQTIDTPKQQTSQCAQRREPATSLLNQRCNNKLRIKKRNVQ
ncbi:MAG: hypothetical protein OJF51_003967 [Nitrospira sp.]|jgi:hypothetical protein|nr:MAG: hypothetical protein OJF51_003967 [Nitrospira sp.]